MEEIPNFEVSKLYDGVRSDGAPVLYILLSPSIDPEKTDYKRIVQGIIKPLVQRLPKFSVYIYDDRQSLILHYKHHSAQPGQSLSRDDLGLLAGHYIARYDRGLQTAKTPNNLAFYPAARPEYQKHRYFEELEYNPGTEP